MNELSAPIWEAANSLEQTWQAAAERWHDVAAAEFEQQHWLPLAAAVADTIAAARTLEDLLATIRSLAGDPA
jgi:hypothetical protein